VRLADGNRGSVADIHRSASEGFIAAAETYVSGRPDYPAAIVQWLREALRLGPGKTALDLGAGTGKFLRYLVATGAEITAVEPLSAMSRLLAADNPQVPVLAGTAEALPLDDASVDAIVCAQSFHWFANAGAMAEISRALKPGGALGLVWNVRDESVAWVAELAEILKPYEGDAPRYYSGDWRKVFPAKGFGPLREHRFPHSHAGRPAKVILDHTLSISFIAALPQSEREKVAARVRDLIAATPELAGRQEVVLPYETHAFSCGKIGAP
jgi:SAM-dependent methyltransferase